MDKILRTDSDIPIDWWKVVCHTIHHPIACVSTDNKFIWVNKSYEMLIGYSLSELRNRSWMDVTVSQDVHGQSASIQDVMSGKLETYSLSNRYRHKHGEEIHVLITAWRFPRNLGDVLCFIVEAIPAVCSANDMQKCRSELTAAIEELAEQVEELMEVKEKTQQQRLNRSGNDIESHDHVTRVNVSTNDSKTMYWLIAAFIAGALLLTYVVWLLTWHEHGGKAPPPQIPHFERAVE